MAQSIDIKRNDTGIGVEAILTDSAGPIDLTGATVRFLYEGNVIICQVEEPTEGRVLVVFNRYNTQKAAIYQAEFEIEHANGAIETAPSNGYITLTINKDLGGINV